MRQTMTAPKRGKKYKSVVDAGCGGYRDYWGEYYCRHNYDWTCDECPWSIENRDKPGEPKEGSHA